MSIDIFYHTQNLTLIIYSSSVKLLRLLALHRKLPPGQVRLICVEPFLVVVVVPKYRRGRKREYDRNEIKIYPFLYPVFKSCVQEREKKTNKKLALRDITAKKNKSKWQQFVIVIKGNKYFT